MNHKISILQQEKGLSALSFSLKGNYPLGRIHIPTLEATQSAHWAVNYSPYMRQSDTPMK
jgi:hypothetical protein